MFAIVMGILVPSLMYGMVKNMLPQPNLVPITPTEETIPDNYIDSPQATESITVPVILPQGVVQTMDMDTYLVGVLLGEMPAEFATEALKAQAVVARTYALKRATTGKKHIIDGVCTEPGCCQAYCDPNKYLSQGGKAEDVQKIKNAVVETTGLVLLYDNKLIDATYYSCSGGKTEDALAVWGTDIPYLQAVESPGEENASHYQDTIIYSVDDFANMLHITTGKPSSWIGAYTYTRGGGVDTVYIAGKKYQGTTLRSLFKLPSTAFYITIEGKTVKITTRGFGHRVGMSQYGAEAMAVAGKGFESILSHYYPGTCLETYRQN